MLFKKYQKLPGVCNQVLSSELMNTNTIIIQGFLGKRVKKSQLQLIFSLDIGLFIYLNNWLTK